jgi:hypothetical protein
LKGIVVTPVMNRGGSGILSQGKIHDLAEENVHAAGKGVDSGVGVIFREQNGADDGLSALLVDGDATRHLRHEAGIDRQDLARVFQAAEMDDLDVWKIGVSPIADPPANDVSAGDAEVAFGNGELQFIDDILEGFDRAGPEDQILLRNVSARGEAKIDAKEKRISRGRPQPIR